jgi:hypothetical protein
MNTNVELRTRILGLTRFQHKVLHSYQFTELFIHVNDQSTDSCSKYNKFDMSSLS